MEVIGAFYALALNQIISLFINLMFYIYYRPFKIKWILESFIKDIIDSTIDICAVYKPNFAFYEKYGPSGMKLLENIVSHINQKSIPTSEQFQCNSSKGMNHYGSIFFT